MSSIEFMHVASFIMSCSVSYVAPLRDPPGLAGYERTRTRGAAKPREGGEKRDQVQSLLFVVVRGESLGTRLGMGCKLATGGLSSVVKAYVP